MPTITVSLKDQLGTDLTVVNAARVSFGKESRAFSDNDEKLIRYLAEHGHYSPFGHCFASFFIKAPIFVARQLVKHKFLRWNEVSRRYVDDEPEFYSPEMWRGRSVHAKQGSEGSVFLPSDMTDKLNNNALEHYKSLLDFGVAPEQARMVLPQSTMTEWWWSGSLDAFADMCNLRCKPDTQKETRIVANEVSIVMGRLFPVSWEALAK